MVVNYRLVFILFGAFVGTGITACSSNGGRSEDSCHRVLQDTDDTHASLACDLFEALKKQHDDSRSFLLAMNMASSGLVDLNKPCDGYTPLLYVLSHENPFPTEYIWWLDVGANPYVVVDEGELRGHSPYSYSVWKGLVDATKIFLERQHEFPEEAEKEILRIQMVSVADSPEGVAWRESEENRGGFFEQLSKDLDNWHRVPNKPSGKPTSPQGFTEMH